MALRASHLVVVGTGDASGHAHGEKAEKQPHDLQEDQVENPAQRAKRGSCSVGAGPKKTAAACSSHCNSTDGICDHQKARHIRILPVSVRNYGQKPGGIRVYETRPLAGASKRVDDCISIKEQGGP